MKNKIESGKEVSIHYKGTFDDGTEFDSSYSRGAPVTFTIGTGEMLPKVEAEISQMSEGETRNFSLSPTDGWGEVIEDAFQSVPVEYFPKDFAFEENLTITGNDTSGNEFTARIHEINDDKITLDLNHPLAGKKLNFEINLLDIK